MRADRGGVIPSPNIWHWPHLYEAENRAQDVDGAVFEAIRSVANWASKAVVDVGCGSGFHLPIFAADAADVLGVEPHEPLAAAARSRVADLPNVDVKVGRADSLPAADGSIDLVHARTAYFFGPGCGPGIREAMRVLRPGGALVVVDLDATASPYGDWMRADLPQYDPAAVEAFFDAQGFELLRVGTRWAFPDRRTLREVMGIEFSPRVARMAAREVDGLALNVRYRIHVRYKPAGVELR
ncbi:SAM-dependent methyltransferase [Rhodococcus sp. 14-2483-1-1]|uniref:class I SAM-dependent methyltransferase n=1 Tax=Rhodococcus sp. 14-2483-1-1 TaxID=2023148 RepID=UPI000B9BBE79|nr:class I SAM-dependent methyltransferase [Rhodococcus sp. 14-2483-1-1]OZF30158.1 SAM-dependent methyltransferase [Rhodococcus sp. 14-2483-1-1]